MDIELLIVIVINLLKAVGQFLRQKKESNYEHTKAQSIHQFSQRR